MGNCRKSNSPTAASAGAGHHWDNHNGNSDQMAAEYDLGAARPAHASISHEDAIIPTPATSMWSRHRQFGIELLSSGGETDNDDDVDMIGDHDRPVPTPLRGANPRRSRRSTAAPAAAPAGPAGTGTNPGVGPTGTGNNPAGTGTAGTGTDRDGMPSNDDDVVVTSMSTDAAIQAHFVARETAVDSGTPCQAISNFKKKRS